MKVKSRIDKDGNIVFDRFIVKKESENFYGVYEHFYGSHALVTSAATRNSACKKAKLLQIGFELGSDYERSW